jgi:anti-sigma B factor antagonist
VPKSLPVPLAEVEQAQVGDQALEAAQDLRVRVARERETVQALKEYLLAKGQPAEVVDADARDSAFAWSVAHAEGDRAVLVFSGEVDYAVAARFREALVDLAEAGAVHLDLDLDGVTFIDSRGLSVLLHARRRCLRQGGSLRVVAVSPQVLRVLRVTGLHHLLLAQD